MCATAAASRRRAPSSVSSRRNARSRISTSIAPATRAADPRTPTIPDPARVGTDQPRQDVAGQQEPDEGDEGRWDRAEQRQLDGCRHGSDDDPEDHPGCRQHDPERGERLEEADHGPPATRRWLERADAGQGAIERALEAAPHPGRIERGRQRRPEGRWSVADRLGGRFADRLDGGPEPTTALAPAEEESMRVGHRRLSSRRPVDERRHASERSGAARPRRSLRRGDRLAIEAWQVDDTEDRLGRRSDGRRRGLPRRARVAPTTWCRSPACHASSRTCCGERCRDPARTTVFASAPAAIHERRSPDAVGRMRRW